MIPNRKAPNVFADTKRFIELAQPDHITPLGYRPQPKTLQLIKHLIDEEVNKELMINLEKMIEHGGSFEQMVQFLDDAVDSIYVIAWAIAALGLPGEAGWNEVQSANMSKFPLVDYGEGKDGEYQEKEILPLDMKVEDVDIKERNGHWIITNKVTGKVVKPMWFKPPSMFEVVHSVLSIQKTRTMPNVISDPFMREYFNEMEARREKKEIDV